MTEANGRRGRFVDFYSALGVPESASFREIEAAYWRQAMRNREALPLLNQAYEVLSHAERRAGYDAERATALKHAAEAARRPAQALASAPAARPPRRSLHEFLD